jgi:steroid delta-isomerase-like uncharacterized protein
MTNTEITKKIHKFFSENKLDDVLSCLADDVVVDSYAVNMRFNGKDEFAGFMMGFKNAFPDMTITHTNVFEQGSWVCAEFTAKGTHTGTLQTPAGPVSATGKEVNLNVCETLEIKDGKIKAIRNYQDSSSLMRQLGLI